MNAREIKWASNHDWFVGAEKITDNEYSAHVREVIVLPNGDTRIEYFTFNDYTQLRQWAGY